MKARQLVALILLLGLGGFLRIYQLGLHSLWLDELATWYDACMGTFQQSVERFYIIEMNPPFYFVVQWLLMRVLPDSEVGLRLPSVIFGIGALGVIFADARRRAGWTAGLAAVAVLATSYQAIYFSQEARAYSLVIFLTLCSSLFWYRCSEEIADGKLKMPSRAGYLISAVLLAWSHYFGILVVMTQAASAFLLIRDRRSLRIWFWLYVGVCVAASPCLLWMKRHIGHGSHLPNPPPLSDFFIYHRWLFGSSSLYGVLSTLLIGVSLWLNRRERQFWYILAGLTWVILPFFLAWGISQFIPIYAIRYMSIGVGPMYLLIGLAAADVGRRLGGGLSAFGKQDLAGSRNRSLPGWATAFIVAVLMILGLHELIWARQHYSVPKSEQRRESVQWIIENASQYPDLAIIGVESAPFLKPISDYYFERLGSSLRTDGIIWRLPEGMAQLKSVLPTGARHIAILGFGFPDGKNEFLAQMRAKYSVVNEVQFNRSGVWVFRIP